MAELTDKQKRFAEEYLIDLNATQSAIRAGYSEDTARAIGCENLTKPDIQEAIQGAMSERSKRTEITADKVLNELAKIGFSEMPDVEIGPDGVKVLTTKTINGSLIAEIDDNPTKRKVKLHDKKGALELLGRHLGMWNDKLKITDERPVINDDIKE